MQTRMIWLDALRLAAGVSMVGLHATSDATGQPFPDFPVEDRIWPLLLRAVIYTARTELFLIISVFLLLLALDRRQRGYVATLAEQAQRLLVPFLFWTVFYVGYNLVKGTAFGYADWVWAQMTSVQSWAGFLLLGTSKYHMHFIPTLFGLLLAYPLYRMAQRDPWLGVLVGLMAKREIDVALWSRFYDADWLPYALRGVKIVTYCGYGMIAGSFAGLCQSRINLERFVPHIVLAGLTLFGVKLYATYLTAISGEWQFNFVPGYWADFLMPVTLFALCFAFARRAWPKWISQCAKYSFGIYLCHPIFLDIAEVFLNQTSFAPIGLVLCKIGFALPMTVGLVMILERSNLLAWTVGLGRLPSFTQLKFRLER